MSPRLHRKHRGLYVYASCWASLVKLTLEPRLLLPNLGPSLVYICAHLGLLHHGACFSGVRRVVVGAPQCAPSPPKLPKAAVSRTSTWWRTAPKEVTGARAALVAGRHFSPEESTDGPGGV